MKTKQEFINISKGFLLGIMVILGATAIAWNGPVSAPPNYNAYAPINVSLASQTKQGALWAASFLTEGGGYFGGNVGIGTSNPAQKLSVVGTIESSSGGFKFPDNSIQIIAARTPTVQVFAQSSTWNKPSGVTKVHIRVIGGGGGGGGGRGGGGCGYGYGGAGGGGGYTEKIINVSGVSSVAVTVGTGGSGGIGVSNYTGCSGGIGSGGGTGGASSFGSYVSATGGTGGAAAPPGDENGNYGGGGGAGGNGSSGDLNIKGGNGYPGSPSGTGSSGVSILGMPTYIAATVGNQYGGGGTGCDGSYSCVAGAGAIGVVIVEEY